MSATAVSIDELLALRHCAAGIDLSSRRRVLTDLAGTHLSGFRGRGIDFEEFRHYAPGDELRSIDWRVTARSGETHVRVFREERERPVLLVVDARAGMQFGTRRAFKSVTAAEAAALCAWAAMRGGDRIGGLIVADGAHQEVRPAGGRRGVMRLLRHLAELQPAAESDPRSLLLTLQRLRRVARPGTLVLMFSDFAGWDEACRRQLLLLARHVELVVGFVHDPLEEKLPPPGRYAVSDGQAQRWLDTGDRRLSKAWAEHFSAHRRSVATAAREARAHWLDLPTQQAPLDSLVHGLGRPR